MITSEQWTINLKDKLPSPKSFIENYKEGDYSTRPFIDEKDFKAWFEEDHTKELDFLTSYTYIYAFLHESEFSAMFNEYFVGLFLDENLELCTVTFTYTCCAHSPSDIQKTYLYNKE